MELSHQFTAAIVHGSLRAGSKSRIALLIRFTLAGLLTLTLLVGCSSASPHGAASSLPVKGGTGAVYVFPLDSYLETPAQQKVEFLAEDILTARCAKGYGISLPYDSVPTSSPTPSETFQSHYLGNIRPISIDDAAAYGYQLGQSGPGPQMGDSVESPAPKSPLDGLSPTELEIVGGWSPGLTRLPKPANPFLIRGGCNGDALRAIGGPHASIDSSTDPSGVDLNYVLGLIQNSTSRAEADPQFISSMQKWSSCMAGSGYSGFPSVLSAILHFDLNKPTTKAQIKMAVQDAKCKIAVGMVVLWVKLVNSFEKQLIDQDSLQLQAVDQRTSLRLKNAAAMVASK